MFLLNIVKVCELFLKVVVGGFGGVVAGVLEDGAPCQVSVDY